MSDQIETAASLMVRDYLLLAFLLSLGGLQIAVSISGIRGLWILPNQLLTRALGILLITVGVATYILSPLWIEGPWAAGSIVDGTSAGREWGTATLSEISAARNINDIHGGMAGTAYFAYFILAVVLATLAASIIGTIQQKLSTPISDPQPSDGENSDGLEALKQTDPLATLIGSLRILRRTGMEDARKELRSAHRWSIPSLTQRMWKN